MPAPSPSSTSSPHAAAYLVSAPGRVNLIGEHTDYNDGLVLPMAIGKSVTMALQRRGDRWGVMRTDCEGGEVRLDLRHPLVAGRRDWSCYPAGVLAGYQALGWEIPGFELDITTTLPPGGGLSSSAAVEVAMAAVIETLCGRTLPLAQKALLCQRAEHTFAGVPCGIMDQFAVTFGKAGHALLLDCRSREMRYIPVRSEAVRVLVVNSGVKHHLADGGYARRRAQCGSAARLLGVASLREVSPAAWKEKNATLPDLERRRARHVITEHARTLAFVAALEKSDWKAAGAAMYGSHESLRGDFGVSCRELDLLVEISRQMPGVHGCRMTGGGFGGCVVALIQPALAATIQQQFRDRYLAATGMDAPMFVTGAGDGPSVTAMP